MASRYGIGIDLGTTNCVLAYVDLKKEDAGATVLPITQRTSLDAIRESSLLPSFFYYATETETARGSLSPFGPDVRDEPIGYVIGSFAQDQMSRLAGRVIHSAKSWLAHGGVDREAPMLPFGSEEIPPELRLSPVEAECRLPRAPEARLGSSLRAAGPGQSLRGAAHRHHRPCLVR